MGKKVRQSAARLLKEISYKSDVDLATVLGLDERTEIRFLGSVRRGTSNTSCRDIYYRVVGSDDVIIIGKNYGSDSTKFYDKAKLEENFMKSRGKFGMLCGDLAKQYDCSIDLVAAIGPELLDFFMKLIQRCLFEEGVCIPREMKNELQRTDCRQQTVAVLAILRPNLLRHSKALEKLLKSSQMCELETRLMTCGQENMSRIVRYLVETFPVCTKSEEDGGEENLSMRPFAGLLGKY